MVQYNYEGVLKDETAKQIYVALQHSPYVLEVTDSPLVAWFKMNLKTQTRWHETDNYLGGTDRSPYEDVIYHTVYKEWNRRDEQNNILGNRFIFLNNQEDYDKVLQWASANGTLVTATPFWSTF